VGLIRAYPVLVSLEMVGDRLCHLIPQDQVWQAAREKQCFSWLASHLGFFMVHVLLSYVSCDSWKEHRASKPCARTIRRAWRNKVSRFEYAVVAVPSLLFFFRYLVLTPSQYYFPSLVIPFFLLAPYMSQPRRGNTFLIPKQHRNAPLVW